MKIARLHSLKVQIILALCLLLMLFAVAIVYTYHHLQAYHDDTVVLRVAEHLDFNVERMRGQAKNYQRNAPRDYPTYYRDLELYYQDLMVSVEEVDSVIGGFASGMLPKRLEGLDKDMMLVLPENVSQQCMQLEDHWTQFRATLMERIGTDPNEPRLEYAATHIVENSGTLEELVGNMVVDLRESSQEHQGDIAMTNQIILVLAALFALMILVWFVLRVLHPLSQAVDGYQRVARGDFGHQVPVGPSNELGLMNRSFNSLSQRIHALFRIMDGLQTGADLDRTVALLGQRMADLVPVDWIGVLQTNPEGRQLRVVTTWSGDGVKALPRRMFSAPHPCPLLQAALGGAALSHQELATPNGDHLDTLCAVLSGMGLSDIAVLRLGDEPGSRQAELRGVLLLGRRSGEKGKGFSPAEVELLHNIAPLLAHGLSRSVQFMDRARLAVLGQFVSGIVHEIRNPLSTISLALDYFTSKPDIPTPAQRRAELAQGEAHRMERLLQDILLYAKPVNLHAQRVDLGAFLKEMASTHQDLLGQRDQQWQLDLPSGITAEIDSDRIHQVLLNLMRNACEAAPRGAMIGINLSQQGCLALIDVQNPGEPITDKNLASLWQPFFTTKSQGTGLGLAIVKRMLDAHGAGIEVTSSDQDGTRFRISLPVSEG